MKILKDTYGFAVQDADGHLTICGEGEKIYTRRAIPEDGVVILQGFNVHINTEEDEEIYTCLGCGEEFPKDMSFMSMEYCTECGTPVEEE